MLSATGRFSNLKTSVGGSLLRDLLTETQWMVKTVRMMPRAKEPRAIPMRSPKLMLVSPEGGRVLCWNIITCIMYTGIRTLWCLLL